MSKMKHVFQVLFFILPLYNLSTRDLYLNYKSSFHMSKDNSKKFNKCWNFLKIFSFECTIQFSGYDDGWLDLCHNFLVYCTRGSLNLIIHCVLWLARLTRCQKIIWIWNIQHIIIFTKAPKYTQRELRRTSYMLRTIFCYHHFLKT